MSIIKEEKHSVAGESDQYIVTDAPCDQDRTWTNDGLSTRISRMYNLDDWVVRCWENIHLLSARKGSYLSGRFHRNLMFQLHALYL